jgi:hypothetical protein
LFAHAGDVTARHVATDRTLQTARPARRRIFTTRGGVLPFWNVQFPKGDASQQTRPRAEEPAKTEISTRVQAMNPIPAVPSKDAAPVDDHLPPQGSRTLVNFLLFVHLFSLGALLALNGSSHSLPNEPTLRHQLRRVPGYYLQLLGMDHDFDSGQRFNFALQSAGTTRDLARLAEELKYSQERGPHEAEKQLTRIVDAQKQKFRDMSRRGLFHLTHADVLDVGHFVELRYYRDGQEFAVGLPDNAPFVARRKAEAAGGGAEPPPLVRPWPHQRYLRYQMLAREVARLAGTDDAQDILPAAITTALLKRNGIAREELDDLNPEFRCLRLTTPVPTQVLSRNAPDAQPQWRDPWHAGWFETALKLQPLVVSGTIMFKQSINLDASDDERDFNKRDFAPPVTEPSPGDAKNNGAKN